MNCPIDGTELAISDRSGIEIDYCPNCRGVWLDRGELDKILERESEFINRGGSGGQGGYNDYQQPWSGAHGGGHGGGHGSRGGRRRGGLLGDLFG